jgi:hypothetical protein
VLGTTLRAEEASMIVLNARLLPAAAALIVVLATSGCSRRQRRDPDLREGPTQPFANSPQPSSNPSQPAGSAAGGVARAPGAVPFEYPVVATSARAGDFVLAPSRSWVDEAFERGADKQTFIYYGGWMREPGPQESLLETLTRQKTRIMNALIIPIRRGERAKPGDVVLTAWASGTGMQRAIVVTGGTPEAPKVRYLDMDYDSPSGWGKKEDVLKPDTFHRLTKPGEVGTTLACAEGGRHARYVLTNEQNDKLLMIGFAGRMRVAPKSECKPLPIEPKLRAGDSASIALVGSFVEGKVRKVDPEVGRVFVEYEFGSQKKQEAVGYTNVAPTL